jgi:hypothetical protein
VWDPHTKKNQEAELPAAPVVDESEHFLRGFAIL